MTHVSEPFRIGIIGAGGMGSFHARALAQLPNVQVVQVADPFGDSADTLATEIGAVRLTDPMEVAANGDLDGVVIASPDHTHAELTLAAMDTGLRVLCEKPLATSVEDGSRVLDAETALGRRVVQLGFMREYDPSHTQALTAAAELGPIHLIRSVHRNTNADARTDLDVIGQSAVHDLHSIRFMTGAEISSVCTYATRRADGGLRHAVIMAEMSNGGHGIVEFDDNGFAYEVEVAITAENGGVTTAPPLRPQIREDASVRIDVGRDWFGWFADAYRIQDAAWIRSLADEQASGPSIWDGFAAQVAVAASLTSLDSGRPEPVELPDRPPIYAPLL